MEWRVLWHFSFVELDEMMMMMTPFLFLLYGMLHEDGVMSVLFLEAMQLGDR